MNVALLIIDPQRDFTDPNIGSLYVEGANEDMNRLARFVTNKGKKIDRIFVTMDTHSKLAIFHPMFWVDVNGERPKPFTAITVEDIESGTWRAAHSEMQEIAERYLLKLRENKRHYPLIVWPEHCLIGTDGWNVHPDLMKTLLQWEDAEFAKVDYVLKGTNIFTEMYSAVRADVIDKDDESTLPNMTLIMELVKYDCIIVAGEAKSHCVSNTVYDLVHYGINPEKIAILTDTMSNVTGFESLGGAFEIAMTVKGAKIATTEDFDWDDMSLELISH